jgi:dolichol-phosphate mannosyltransferase
MFLLIGLLGEYVGLIYSEVKGRPLFIVDQLVGIEERKNV